MLFSTTRILNKKKKIVGPIADYDIMIFNDVGVANIINGYFCSIFTDERSPIPEPMKTFNSDQNDGLDYITFTAHDVSKLLRSL